jgi:hypothetical protein
MPYQGTSKISAQVSVHCESCGNDFVYERTLRGTAQRAGKSAAINAAREKLAKKMEKIESGDYGPIAIHKPCPQCGYVQSWMVEPVRRRRGWQWALGLAILSYFLAFSALSFPGGSDCLLVFLFFGMPTIVFFVARIVIMKLYRPNKNLEVPAETNVPSVSYSY